LASYLIEELINRPVITQRLAAQAFDGIVKQPLSVNFIREYNHQVTSQYNGKKQSRSGGRHL
jgi:hypothetical protein